MTVFYIHFGILLAEFITEAVHNDVNSCCAITNYDCVLCSNPLWDFRE